MSKLRKQILIAPLDWGLGHATRCIPIVRKLLSLGHNVLTASSGQSLLLLKKEFPELKSFELPAYKPHYPHADGSMIFTMATQLLHFIRTIERENIVLGELIEKENIDVVISDNRYGCHSRKAKSIFLGHQMNILMPSAWFWMEPVVNKLNRHILKKFAEVWVPADDNQLFQKLLNTEIKIRYIGYLSRFNYRHESKKYEITGICSGPEPQRTILENILIREFTKTSLRWLLVKGVVKESQTIETVGNNGTVVNYMQAEELNKAILQSGIVVSRSGYSTVMDLMQCCSSAIFIPTPGQTEQEYIARILSEKKIALAVNQAKFNLKEAVDMRTIYNGFNGFNSDDLRLAELLNDI